MKLNEKVFSETLKELSKVPYSGRKNRAENTSSHSDILLWKIHPEVLKTARGARLAAVAITFLGLNPVQEYDLRRQLAIIAHKFKFQGEWNRVREILLVKPFRPGPVLNEHLKDRSPQDYFGNDLKELKRIYYNGLKSFNPYEVKNSRVKYPQRKRGYDDKGSLPKSSYGAGDTTRIIPRERREELIVHESEEKLFQSDVMPSEKIYERGTLGEKTTSSKVNLKKLDLF